MGNIFGTEPTLILGFIRALMVMAVSFGLNLSEAQFVAVYAAVELLATIINRAHVTPADKPESVDDVMQGSRRLS